MPYTHMFRRSPELSKEGFDNLVQDVRVLLEKAVEIGLSVNGPTGYGKPVATHSVIAINGNRDCGHRFRDFGDPWPADDASGIDAVEGPSYADVPYWSGERLRTRVCHGGTCAQMPLVVDRVFMPKHWTVMEKGGYFCKCETQFKPYDLIVTAVLIRMKEHLRNEVFVNSDGHEKAFEDARRLCRDLFGWPRYFELEPVESEIV